MGILPTLTKQYPKLRFAPAANFIWSPQDQTVYYDRQHIETPQGLLALLHEVGHALLGHQTYDLDIELLNMEVEAWTKARELASGYQINVSERHIENCLDTYRVWLFKRSRCPQCGHTSLQHSSRSYHCFVCYATWEVAATRSLQPRRMNCTLPSLAIPNQ